MKTLPDNYKKNIEILKINLERGMSYEMAKSGVDAQEKSFVDNNLYDETAKEYIQDLRAVLLGHFTATHIQIVRVK